VSKAASGKINEVRELLLGDIDPGKETSTLGRALRAIRDMLDPKRVDSVQGSLETAIKQVTTDGGPLAKAVREVVNDALKPLEDRLNDLAKEIRGQEAAEVVVEQTTLKGASFEEEVVCTLQDWAQRAGAEVNYVGRDNRPGDIVVVTGESVYAGENLRVVVEARDRQKGLGRLAVSETLDAAMSERKANAAIYVSRTRDGLGHELGEWSEGISKTGRWVACTRDHLVTAVRFVIVQERVHKVQASAPRIDAASIEAHIQRIRTALARIKTINTKATEIRSCSDDVRSEAEGIREEIRGALSDIEESLRSTGSSHLQQAAAY
jgi:ElaB/YqjD/DUF883 family membrane-anchored ribosome-binding protein